MIRRVWLGLAVLAFVPLPAHGGAAGLVAPASNAAWARAAVAALARATIVNDADANKLFDDLDAEFAAAPDERLPAIVSFVQGVATSDGMRRVATVTRGAPVGRRFHIVPAYAGSLSRDEAHAVAALDVVRQVEFDNPGAPELDTATRFMGADAVVDEMGITGSMDGDPGTISAADVGIGVLDTGFDAGHRDLGDGKIRAFVDLGDGLPEPYDPEGHGSHVASIAAGWGRADSAYRGVAPGAAIIGIKIIGEDTNVESNAIAGYEWIVDNKATHNIRVATMSFGFGPATDGTTALERAVDAAWAAGIVCFKSNGNAGPQRRTMTVPAAARGILAIGSMLDPAGDNRGEFGFGLARSSSRGPTSDGRIKPDLIAPGSSITAAEAGTEDGYVTISGTSMASPFAAGAAALMIAAVPSLMPDEVREVLYETTQDWGPIGPDSDYGYGRIQVREAVRKAMIRRGETPPPSIAPVVPVHHSETGSAPAGAFQASFDVADLTHPVRATVIGAGGLGGFLRDPGGRIVDVLLLPGDLANRQLDLSSFVSETGRYTLVTLFLPGAELVLDLSHSTAPF